MLLVCFRTIFYCIGLEKLESLRFGDKSFCRTKTLYIVNMPKLNLISFGSMSFYDVKTAHFMSTFENVLSKIDLPELTKIKLTSCVADKATTVTFSSIIRIILFQ